MKFAVVGVVLYKELLDLIRDRRTLISIVLAPMLVGPAIMGAMNYFMRRTEAEARVQHFKVGLKENVRLAGLRDALAAAGLDVGDSADPRRAVERKEVTFGIEVDGTPAKPDVRFFSDNSDITAAMGRNRVNSAFDRLEKHSIRAALARNHVPETVLEPFSRQSINVAQPRKMTGAFIGRLIGFLLLIFLFNGAMYAAVDTTAGEKERRTIEVLLSSAAGRTEIVVAKILTAMTTSIGTSVLSMLSYGLAFTAMESGRPGSPGVVFPTDAGTLLLLAMLIVPVSALAASMAIAGSTPAKSSREAMSYLTPAMFVVSSLGMVTFLPGVESSTVLALIPFANFAQMLREVLSGEISWVHYGVTLCVNLLFAVGAAALAISRFRNEKILFRT